MQETGEGVTTLLRSNNIKNDRVNFDDVQFVAGCKISEDQLVRPFDIAICMSNGSKALVGKSGVVTPAHLARHSRLTVGAFCAIYRSPVQYTAQIFKSQFFQSAVDIQLAGSAINNLKGSDIEGIQFPLPPLEEQQKIAAILTAVDDKLDVIARQIDATQSLKQGLVQTLFSRGVGTQDAAGEWVPHTEFKLISSRTVPVAWSARRLGEIAPLVRRPVEIDPDAIYPELGLRSYGKGTFHKPALTGAEVGNKRLFQIKTGDLLFSNVFAWEGAVAVARPEDDGRYGSHRYITCAVDASQADTNFLFRYLTTPAGIASLTLASPGGAGRNKTLGLGALADIAVPLPPLNEQRKIGQILDGVDAKLHALDSKRAACEALKRGLMQKLLTGEWRVNVDPSATGT